MVSIVITLFPTFSRGCVFYVLAMLRGRSFLLSRSLQPAKASSRGMASGVLDAAVIYLPVVLGIMIVAKR